MENKLRLQELLAQGQVLENMSNDDLQNLYNLHDSLSSDEWSANKNSLLFRTICISQGKVSAMLHKRAAGDADEAFTTILEHYLESKRVSSSINDL